MAQGSRAREPGLTRRELLQRGALAGAGLALPLAQTGCISRYPFVLGVASGDPTSRSVVLWTRLVPEPFRPFGGLPPIPFPVQWEVATDSAMTNVIRSGTAVADPAWAHAVHVDALGLPPDSWLWYRFSTEGFASPIGRTRTFPDPGTQPSRMRYALASCQNYSDGGYTSYYHMALESDLDCVVHVGDYIYEEHFGSRLVQRGATIPVTLDEYRTRYTAYKLDPHLKAMHASVPFIHTWDDHEVLDGYASIYESDKTTSPEFLARRAAAYQAHLEHLPLRTSTAATGPGSRLYRRFRFGDLAELVALDTRGHRDNKVCNEPLPFAFADLCPEAFDPSRSFLGVEQEAWLARRLDRSQATWNILAQGVMVMEMMLTNGFVNLDAWTGYPAARTRLLDAISTSGAKNPIVLAGDMHSSWVADLKVDSYSASSPVVGTEFVGPAISSLPGSQLLPFVDPSAHPHLRYLEAERNGYVVFDVTPERCRAEYRMVEGTFRTQLPIETLATFELPEGGTVAQV